MKEFSGSSWLLIFHHDSFDSKYFSRDNCKYNIDPQLYSLIDDENLYREMYKNLDILLFY